MAHPQKPIVLITGAAGNIGRSLAAALCERYRVVGLDMATPDDTGYPVLEVDLTDQGSVDAAVERFRKDHGDTVASVIHLAAFFDFSGEDKPQYHSVNVEGTRHLLRALKRLEVGQFVYSGTMLVHAPGKPGETIDERQPIDPRWAYPKSKAETEAAIREEHGDIPAVFLHLAGLYDEETSVPTFAHQIARIYERELESHFYSGSLEAGQAMLHREDMIDAFVRTVDRRDELAGGTVILIGEREAIGYGELQERLGCLIHGETEWETIRVPAPVAAAGAWAQAKAEPLIPDAIDRGEEPFIKPFMTAMASDHYALDISLARELLGWEPRHRLTDKLPSMIATLKHDPKSWYEANKIPVPGFVEEAGEAGRDAEDLRAQHEAYLRREQRENRWAHFLNMALGSWLLLQPVLIAVREPGLIVSESVLGAALMVFAALSLSWRMPWARWICAGIGALVAAAPFLFWTQNGAAYLSDTLVGGMVFGLAVGTRPEPGPSAIAVQTGPEIPPGWDYNPSTWTQRIPIIVLAIIGLYVSRYLAAYQLGHIDSVWDPFFAGSSADPRNGTEEIITSSVSRAWPVPDAAVGGYTYLLEIVTGVVGTQRRWRTMPWLVVLFGLMIAPLGVVSISFIVIQPIVIGTWSTIALIGAAAMLIQIPYSLDELIATCQFLRRRVGAGKTLLRVFLFGDTDEGDDATPSDEFDRGPGPVVRDMVAGGVNLPWNLAVAGILALSLLFTRVTLGAEGAMANSDHLIGSLALTVISIAAAEVTRAARFLLIPLGAALAVTALLQDADGAHLIASIAIGSALALLSLRRGRIACRYGHWNRLIV